MKRLIRLIVLCVLISLTFTGCMGRVPADGSSFSVDGIKWSDVNRDENTAVIIDAVADIFKEPDILSERITQAIFNQPVTILEDTGSWINVEVADGSTGWVRSKFVSRDNSSIDVDMHRYRVIVTAVDRSVISNLRGGGIIQNVVMGTEFFSRGRNENYHEISLPGNIIAWIAESGTIQIPINRQIQHTSAEDFIATAIKFKGTSYMIGGISKRGIDSSGIIYISAKVNGIDLPRDLEKQFKFGVEVNPDHMEPGDLIFISEKADPDEISYAGIYINKDSYLYACRSKGYVLIASLSEESIRNRIMGIRRIF